MSPLDSLNGPEFLVFYGGVILLTLFACWWALRTRVTTAALPPLLVPTDPDP